MTARVVLVHGAWHGAWCWAPVVDLLRAEGVDVVAVDLPGHGADAGPLTDLHGDAVRVREALDAGEGPAVLVGHSYGGAVVTEAGVHPDVVHVVYVAAFALDAGETLFGITSGDPGGVSGDRSGRPDLAAALVFGEDSCTVDPAQAGEIFFNDLDRDAAAAATAQLGPQPTATFGQSPTAVAWRERPSTYAICELDMAIHPDLQASLAQRTTDVVTWPTSHSPFLSRPDLVADLLLGLSRS